MLEKVATGRSCMRDPLRGILAVGGIVIPPLVAPIIDDCVYPYQIAIADM